MILKTTCIFVLLSCMLLASKGATPEPEHHDEDDHHDTDDHDSEDHSKHHDAHDKPGHHDENFDHDAVVGSHHESEEFKDLEPEEAKRRLGLLVDKMDTNADHNVTQTELYLWILKSLRDILR